VQATDSSNHDKFAQLAEVAPEMRDVLARGIGANPGAATIGETVAENPVGAIATLQINILNAPVNIITGQ